MNILKYHVILLGLISTFSSKAQFTIEPNQNHYKNKNLGIQEELFFLESEVVLTLPFLDDFSTTITNYPDTCIWENSKNTFVNNTFQLNAPSYNIVTLDGVDSTGTPYQTADPFAQGGADTLASKALDLSINTPVDSIYISFYWQLEGIGEVPDIEDFLILEIKDLDGNWDRIWDVQGGNAEIKADSFYQEVIKIEEAKYFHADFQFRFRNTSRLSGAFDTWHLDYIYMDVNRTFDDIYRRDVAPIRTPEFLLSRYSAMPVHHYFLNPNVETVSSLSTEIFNPINESQFNSIDYHVEIEDTITNTLLATLPNPTGSPFIIEGQKRQEILVDVPLDLLTVSTNPLALKTSFIVDTQEDDMIIPPFDLTQNDTISSMTILHDYYAYDDGTAEYGAGINQRFGQVAYQFELLEDDFLTDVEFHFTRLGFDLTGQTFVLTVWKDLEGTDNSILYEKSVAIIYPEERTEFVSYPLDISLELTAGTYYVGWRQTTNDRLNVGFDRNTNSGEKIFFNIDGNEWIQNTDFEGSLLLRPVFGEDIVSSLEDKVVDFEVTIYPNPTQDKFYLEGRNLKSVQIYDLQGKKLFEQSLEITENKHLLNVQNLSKGIKVVKVFNTQNQVVSTQLVIY